MTVVIMLVLITSVLEFPVGLLEHDFERQLSIGRIVISLLLPAKALFRVPSVPYTWHSMIMALHDIVGGVCAPTFLH